MYFHFRSMRISSLVKLQESTKLWKLWTIQVYVPLFWLYFLNSSRSTGLKFPISTHHRMRQSQSGHRAHMLSCPVFFEAVGLFRSDMLLIFNMVWPWFSCGTVCVCPQFPYRGNDMIFWIFPFVPCHAFCMWHYWPIGKDLYSSFIWGHHHLILSEYMDISRPAEYFI